MLLVIYEKLYCSGGSRISQTGSANQQFGLIFPKNCINKKEIGPGGGGGGGCIFEQGSFEYVSESFLQFHQCEKDGRHSNTLLISKRRVARWQDIS